ncbi:hypothetical protein GMRT_14664 [Giardia muris]|uniref:Uncharacterized protein n=1 Tax=Giardia muris TaxID=5742 RepID=A0A4Z1T1Z2_GIAMU|nr:hypothetical protein GMRT_14664 [Giardia muris]|eukprot:TNJ26421.1 hypothetical protein GMRT_14664 [Giardia muris]
MAGVNVPLQQSKTRIAKRYSEAQPKMTRTNIARIIVLISTLLLAGTAVFLIVYFTTKKPTYKPPAYQTVSDDLFADYLLLSKGICAWSHTSESKLDGEPSYGALLRNKDNSFDYLLNFSTRHAIDTIYLYGGCAQWDSNAWASGLLPYEADLRSASRKAALKGLRVGIVTYLNDDADNLTSYSNIRDFSKAVLSFKNELATAATAGTSIAASDLLVQCNLRPTQPEAYAYALETFYLLRDALSGSSIAIEGIILPNHLEEWKFRPELYQTLGITPIVMEMLEAGEKVSYASVLSKLVDTVMVLAESTNEYVLIEQWEATLKLFKTIRPMYDMSDDALGSQVYRAPDGFLSILPTLAALCRTYNRLGHECGPPMLSSYVDYHKALYIQEPIKSNSGFLIDLYYNVPRSGAD